MKDYLYVGSKLVAEYQSASGKYYYYMSDQVNSTRMVTDDVGTVVHSVTYDPYGGPQKTWIKTYEPKLKFSGKEREIASELDYFGARYYDHIGYRFVSVDPIINKIEAIANPQKWNLYSYCDNNPITYFDPDGQSIWGAIERFGIKVGSAIGSGAEWAWDNRQGILETTVGSAMIVAGAVIDLGTIAFTFGSVASGGGTLAAAAVTAKVSDLAMAAGAGLLKSGLSKMSTNEKGGGKTGQKINQKRKDSFENQLQEARDKFNKAKTKAEKKELKDLMKHLRTKMHESELHARKGQGYR